MVLCRGYNTAGRSRANFNHRQNPEKSTIIILHGPGVFRNPYFPRDVRVLSVLPRAGPPSEFGSYAEGVDERKASEALRAQPLRQIWRAGAGLERNFVRRASHRAKFGSDGLPPN